MVRRPAMELPARIPGGDANRAGGRETDRRRQNGAMVRSYPGYVAVAGTVAGRAETDAYCDVLGHA